MDRTNIEALLNEVREGRVAVNEALDRLRDLPFEDLGFAKLDHHRALRTGMPEVLFAQGKTVEQVAKIFDRMAKAGGNVLATRASADMFRAVREVTPRAEFHETARAITLEQAHRPRQRNHRRSLRRHQRFAGSGGSSGHGPADGKYRGVDRRRRRSGHSSLAGAKGIPAVRAGAHRLRRNGRRIAHCSRRTGERAGAGRANQCRVWSVIRRSGRAAGHAEYLLAQRIRGQYRQRIRRGLHRFAYQSAVIACL